MDIFIFDTSVWIDFSKGIANDSTIKLEEELEKGGPNLYLTPTIIQEFLMGVKTEKDFASYLFKFTNLKILKSDWETVSIACAKLYFNLRKKGLTIRKSTDCLIAQVAIQNNAILVHNDIDFDQIALNSELRTFKK